MQFSDTVKTVTRERIIPKVFDTVLTGNVGLLRTLGNSKPWRSGFRLDVPIKYQRSNTGGLVPLGGTLDTTRTVTRVKMQFDPKRRHKPVVMDDIEVQLNKGDEQVIELMAVEMDELAQEVTDELGDDFYTGTGSGDNFDSLLNASDDSTNFSSYGSLSRSTYGHNGYLATGIGSLALSDLSTMYNNVKIGADRPSLILADVTSWTAYEGLLQPTVQAGYQTNGFPQVTRTGTVSSRKGLGGDIGFDSVFYRGTPVVEDEKVSSGNMFAMNEDYFNFHGVDLDEYEDINISEDSEVDGPQSVSVPSTRGFNWSGLMRPVDQPSTVGHIYWIGNFVAKDPRRQGNIQGITG